MTQERELQAIGAAVIFTGEEFLDNHCIILQGDTIVSILPDAQCPPESRQIDLTHGTLAPGLIDLQVNGGGGVLLNDNPTPDGVKAVAAAHLALGTTTLIPTMISDRAEIMQAAASAVMQCREQEHAGIGGLHIEGPFFELQRRGAHSKDHIRKATQEDIEWLCSLSHLPLLLTLAPEHLGPEQVSRLSEAGVIVCAGHTNATHEQMNMAINAGLQGVTHLYNAMSGPTAREPGTVGTTLADDRLWASIIADGHHVHPENIRIAHRAKPAGGLILVSDAMATVGAEEKSFVLYGEVIAEENGRLVNSEGVLAGSAVCLMDAVRVATTEAGIPLEECLKMASLYPARILGMDEKLGHLAPGFRADLIHFDGNLKVQNTWLAGQRIGR
jgi:N-acetylglucosamine-6-phosphate deacetylase